MTVGTIFLSYAHADQKPMDWVKLFHEFIDPFMNAPDLEEWDDGRIQPGADWQKEIEAALERAMVSVLFVGNGFLGSSFISEHELPVLLQARRDRGLTIFPVVIRECLYERSKLASMQAANDPKKPWEGLPGYKRQKVMREFCARVLACACPAAPEVTAFEVAEPMPQVFETESARSGGAGMGGAAGSIGGWRSPPHDRLNDMESALRELGISYTGFQSQILRAQALMQRMVSRLKITKHYEYEKFFFEFFGVMNDIERFEFQQIRALTEGVLAASNRRIQSLLDRWPDLSSEIPRLAELRRHLSVWLNKFDRVFMPEQRMCVCFTGVEDGVPFPAGVEENIEAWLLAHP
jgi:hypothetical protein